MDHGNGGGVESRLEREVLGAVVNAENPHSGLESPLAVFECEVEHGSSVDGDRTEDFSSFRGGECDPEDHPGLADLWGRDEEGESLGDDAGDDVLDGGQLLGG